MGTQAPGHSEFFAALQYELQSSDPSPFPSTEEHPLVHELGQPGALWHVGPESFANLTQYRLKQSLPLEQELPSGNPGRGVALGARHMLEHSPKLKNSPLAS